MSLTTQEKLFADECVFAFFHEMDHVHSARGAAKVAEYEIPVDVRKADDLVKSILEKTEIKEYMESEIERFRSILSGNQRKKLWEHISDFEPSVDVQKTKVEYGAIVPH